MKSWLALQNTITASTGCCGNKSSSSLNLPLLPQIFPVVMFFFTMNLITQPKNVVLIALLVTYQV